MARLGRAVVLLAVAASALCFVGALASRSGWEDREDNLEGKLRDLRLLGILSNTKDEQALIMAATDGDIGEVERLLEEGVDVEVRTARQSTPLILAAFMGHLDIVELLIAEGADVNSTDVDDLTSLHFASAQNHTDVAQVLVDNGADPNKQGATMVTPLFFAAQSDATGTLEFLLGVEGIDVELDNSRGWTPLIVAADMGNMASVALLLGAQADPMASSDLRATALHRAALTLNATEPLNGTNVLSLLINDGAEVDATDSAGDTPLEYASWAGNTPAVQILMNAGANASMPDVLRNLPADALCSCLTTQRCATPCDQTTNDTILALLDGEMPVLRPPTAFEPSSTPPPPEEDTTQVDPVDDGVKEVSPEVVQGAGTAVSPLWATVCLWLAVALASSLGLC